MQQGLRVIDPELGHRGLGRTGSPHRPRAAGAALAPATARASGDIATNLNLSEGTVRNYLSEAISKLGASNRVEAARIARTKGWL